MLLSAQGSVHVWLGAEHAQQLGPGVAPQAAAARVAAAAAAAGVPVPSGAQVPNPIARCDSFWLGWRKRSKRPLVLICAPSTSSREKNSNRFARYEVVTPAALSMLA